jgi:hypothetical protein
MSWMTSGFAGPGQQHSFDAILKAGTSNIVYVRPEEDVTVDLDLHVYDENGSLVAYDDHVDMDAACRVTPRWTGPFRIVVSSAQGSSRFALLIKTLNN